MLLRLEGAAVLAVASIAYHQLHPAWSLYLWVFFLPDVGMLGYIAGPRIGSWTYNTTHCYLSPLLAAILLTSIGIPLAIPLALIWVAHIGFDRALGYGLKYATSFGDTHFGKIGKWKNS